MAQTGGSEAPGREVLLLLLCGRWQWGVPWEREISLVPSPGRPTAAAHTHTHSSAQAKDCNTPWWPLLALPQVRCTVNPPGRMRLPSRGRRLRDMWHVCWHQCRAAPRFLQGLPQWIRMAVAKQRNHQLGVVHGTTTQLRSVIRCPPWGVHQLHLCPARGAPLAGEREVMLL